MENGEKLWKMMKMTLPASDAQRKVSVRRFWVFNVRTLSVLPNLVWSIQKWTDFLNRKGSKLSEQNVLRYIKLIYFPKCPVTIQNFPSPSKIYTMARDFLESYQKHPYLEDFLNTLLIPPSLQTIIKVIKF